MRKNVLGKGLQALISDNHISENVDNLQHIPLDKIKVNEHQPRKDFNEEALNELAVSIQQNGILQPLIVIPLGEFYQIIIGERRFRAAKLANFVTVPCLIKNVSNAQILEWALIENLQREDLNPVEIAKAYQELIIQLEMKQEEFAHYIGKSRSSVANSLRLLKLPEIIQEDIIMKNLSEGHARSLINLGNKESMLQIRDKIIKDKLSVRETESLVKSYKDKYKEKVIKEVASTQKDKKIFFQELEKQLSIVLSTKVMIAPKNKEQGKFELYYSNAKEFENIKNLIQTAKKSGQYY